MPFQPPQNIDTSLYGDRNAARYPTITYMGKYVEGATAGYFVFDRDDIDPDVVGDAFSLQEHEIRFGTDPNNPLTPVYICYRLPVAVIAVRKRWEVKDAAGLRHYYPLYTKRDQRVIGKMTSQYQALVALPNVDQLFVLSLRGYSKSTSWSNDPNRRGSRTADFGYGVEERAAAFAGAAWRWYREEQGYQGPPFPWMCMFWLPLVPQSEPQNGRVRARWVDVGHGTHYNPFTADMPDDVDMQVLDDRYVGQELFDRFSNTRAEIGIEWEREWSEAREAAPADDGPLGAVEDDINDIPF